MTFGSHSLQLPTVYNLVKHVGCGPSDTVQHSEVVIIRCCFYTGYKCGQPLIKFGVNRIVLYSRGT